MIFYEFFAFQFGGHDKGPRTLSRTMRQPRISTLKPARIITYFLCFNFANILQMDRSDHGGKFQQVRGMFQDHNFFDLPGAFAILERFQKTERACYGRTFGYRFAEGIF
jgi:hypothetical protein